MITGTFLSRTNRFIAEVELGEKVVIAHVPNTGRCKELLIPGVRVYLKESNSPARKTKYSLLGVENRGGYVSIDSQEPNKVVEKGLKEGKIASLKKYTTIRREKTVSDGRLDFYLLNGEEDAYMEVKGVTLVEGNTALFPDAPTIRGSKHLETLIRLKKEGHEAVVFFLIQHHLGNVFRPNRENDPKFAETLKKAKDSGVKILAYRCIYDENHAGDIGEEIPVEI